VLKHHWKQGHLASKGALSNTPSTLYMFVLFTRLFTLSANFSFNIPIVLLLYYIVSIFVRYNNIIYISNHVRYIDCEGKREMWILWQLVFLMYKSDNLWWNEVDTHIVVHMFVIKMMSFCHRINSCLPHGIPASIWVFGLNFHHTPSMVCFIDINFFYE
jgi:hypothetical protein